MPKHLVKPVAEWLNLLPSAEAHVSLAGIPQSFAIYIA